MSATRNDTISVIIPTWNRETTLGSAIKSALAQTHSPTEILVCDDGSTDRSRELVDQLRTPKVRWVSGPRGGRPAIPRNRGIGEAKGEWLAFLDSDDIWLPDKLARQVGEARRLQLDAVCTNAWHVGPAIEGRRAGGLMRDRVIGQREALPANPIHTSTVLVRRSVMLRTGGFPENAELVVGEDYAAWLRVLVFSNFAYLGEPLIEYFDDPVTSVRAYSTDGWTQQARVLQNFLEWCRSYSDGVPRPMVRAAEMRRAYARLRGAIRPWLRRTTCPSSVSLQN